jgi:hypothetical protein
VQNCVAYLVHSEWKQKCSRLYKESICYHKLLKTFITEGSFRKQHNILTEAENFILSSINLWYMGSRWYTSHPCLVTIDFNEFVPSWQDRWGNRCQVTSQELQLVSLGLMLLKGSRMLEITTLRVQRVTLYTSLQSGGYGPCTVPRLLISNSWKPIRKTGYVHLTPVSSLLRSNLWWLPKKSTGSR